MRALFVAACFVMGVACSGRVEMVQDSEATASQGIAAGSTGGAANVFTLVQAIGAQSQFSLDGITESVSEFNGVLSVTVPAFQSGGMSGAIVYSSGHDILQLNGSTTPKHQGVAGRWNSNFFGRFVDIETRAQASEGPNLDGWNVGFLNPVSHGAYFVETAGGSRLSWLSRDVHSPRLPSTSQPPEGLLEDGSVVEVLPQGGYAVLWRGGGRTEFTHRAGSEWQLGAEGFYATRIQSLDGKTTEVSYYGDTPIPRVATEYWPVENGGRVPVSRVFFFLEGEDSAVEPQNRTGLSGTTRLGSIRYPGALAQSRTVLDAGWLETKFHYGAANQQLEAVELEGRKTTFRYGSSRRPVLLGIDRPSGSRVDFAYGVYRMPVGYCVPFGGACEPDIVRDTQGFVVLSEDGHANFTYRPWYEVAYPVV